MVLCKYCSGDLQMRERRVKENDKGRIKVKCRYTSDITCSYFTAPHLNINSEHSLGVLTQCVSHTWSAKRYWQKKKKSILAFEGVRFASTDEHRRILQLPSRCMRCAVNVNILLMLLNPQLPLLLCKKTKKSWDLGWEGGCDCVVLSLSSSSEPLVPPLCYDPYC